jgi:hypothetical protein
MELRVRVLGIVIGTALAVVMGCQKTETPSGGGQPSSSAAATSDSHPPFGMFNTPGEGETVANKIWCTGWALDDSGIAQVTGMTENGTVSPAKIDQPFPGVKEAYPNLPGNDKAGFILQIPDLPPGPHTIKVEIVAKDGGKTTLVRNFIVK